MGPENRAKYLVEFINKYVLSYQLNKNLHPEESDFFFALCKFPSSLSEDNQLFKNDLLLTWDLEFGCQWWELRVPMQHLLNSTSGKLDALYAVAASN